MKYNWKQNQAHQVIKRGRAADRRIESSLICLAIRRALPFYRKGRTREKHGVAIIGLAGNGLETTTDNAWISLEVAASAP